MFKLILITDWTIGRRSLLAKLEQALGAGPDVAVQHRHPGAKDRDFLEEARELSRLCAARGNPLFINGRLDVALLLGAHLHLPSHGLRVGDVRPHLPTDRMLGVAVHDEREAAEARGADLALISPVFSPGSKPGDTRPTLGVDGFRRIASGFGGSSFALGGISVENAGTLTANGFAVVSAIWAADDPLQVARDLISLAGNPSPFPLPEGEGDLIG